MIQLYNWILLSHKTEKMTFAATWMAWEIFIKSEVSQRQKDKKSWLIIKDSDAGSDWGQEEKGTTEDEMAGWHHWLYGLESEWTPGVGDGQGDLACCDSWGPKELDMTERLIWSDLTSVWDECNCVVVWAFFGIAFLWDWNENWHLPVLWPLLSFPISLAYCVQHFHSIIF